MKSLRKPLVYPPPGQAVVTVREAKAHFSALLARAAAGEEITIAWHGQPRARLTAIGDDKVLRVDKNWLRSMPVRRTGAGSEDIIRADRDGRG
jgi:prevent-host-death family protein